MANILETTTCISVQDIKDSLTGDIINLDDPEITKLIIRAENKVNAYLSEIGSDYWCNQCVNCEHLPDQIKAAIVLATDEIYTNEQNANTWPQVRSRSEKSCDMEITEEYCNVCTDTNPCDDLWCDIVNMLKCFEVTGFDFEICSQSCGCDSECNECWNCTNNNCKKCLMKPF